jgi:FkbM family methyltransferase
MKPPPYMLRGSPMQLDYFFPHESLCYAEVMKASPKNRRQVAIDIGSCEGLWTINLADHFETVHAFEPMPDILTLSKRWFPENVVTYNYALSDTETIHEMIFFEWNIGMTMKTGNDFIENHMRNSPSKKFTVQTKTLDSFNFENVGFIKIDAEGEDANVLKGAEQTIEKCRPLILIDCEHQHELQNYNATPIPINDTGSWLYEPKILEK